LARFTEEEEEMSAVDTYIETETERVERWRMGELLRVGFDVESATLLAAELGVDLHAAIDMVERGCPPDLAARILL
jgi:ABC-type amino acid transport substrate-binding protein